MSLNEIYTELIRYHNKNPKNRKDIPNATIKERGHNPSCGDDIILHIKIEGDIVVDAGFTGVGCAISQASASIMIDLIRGKKIEEIVNILETFLGMIKKDVDDEEQLNVLGDAAYFKNISNMPARVKCGVLPWHSLKIALEKIK
ncbi:Fe-S cluster assembly sulfur transfer protein SufU [Proteiniborus sp. MB09-C3]|uniref:Fe-S cluster assembly sulfur transfer protein SufU n=1 Tax=Proteiniborus sp. MB09-C3 TaxID=3050072 RepID=UPI002552F2EE|nr:SUF system NifU family Fe-S cluster assembly protein [Proteiniborus sp. MB09-C3]WIV13347.1 SUF system NifU family Fe-S cluster assembly protein [Proteiniborus sp. MB09-C3]